MFCVAILLYPAFCGHALDYSGRPVKEIVFQDDLGNPWPGYQSLLPLLVTTQGSRFSYQAVRSDIEYLYLKGLFRDIRVDAFPKDDGVRLVYTLFPIDVVEKVTVRGTKALPKSAVLELVSKLESKELREDRLSELRMDILSLYHTEGYFGAKVEFRKTPATRPHRFILNVDIDESAPTIIEEITFRGNKVFSAEELLAVMKSRKGSPLRRDLILDTDLEAIKKLYAEAGYPAASLDVVDMNFRNGKAYVTMAGKEGPKVTVSFIGNQAISKKELQKALLIWSEHDVSDATLDSSADKIRDIYLKKGYMSASVEVKKKEGPGTLDIVFQIKEGQMVSVAKIEFSGNIAFSEKELKKRMLTRESGWFRSRPFVHDLFNKDIDVIRDIYLDAGYMDVLVAKDIVITADGKAILNIRISEGRRTIVGMVSFEGNNALSGDELRAILTLTHGSPFNERVLEEDRYRILSAYSQRGYIYSKVDAETSSVSTPPAKKESGPADDDGERVMDIIFHITEDLPASVGRIIIRGNEITRDKVITRELLVGPGRPYNYEDILKSQQRLYRLGYFSVVRFEPLRVGEREYKKDLLLTLEERPAGAVEVGLGYGDLDRLRGFIEVSHRNIAGSGRSASIRFEGSDILQRAVLNFKEPWFLNRRLDGMFTLSWSDTDKINTDTREIYYQTRKTTASFGVQKILNSLRLSLIYQYENVENYNVQPGAALSPEDEGRVRISSLTPALIRDMRDDPFNPRRGTLQGIALKEAMSAIGSEADFTKVTLQSIWFFPLNDTAVLALSGRLGMAWPHRATVEVPLHERFYLGGGSTIRGYLQDLVGPTTPGATGVLVPTGGEAMALGNIEIRLNPAGGVGFVLFSDAGNVWQERTFRVNDIRASYGAGIRLNTPVGPLRLDYGQKIHRRSGESPGELHFSLGHAF